MGFFLSVQIFTQREFLGVLVATEKIDLVKKINSRVCTHRIANNNWFSGCGTSTTDIIKKLP